MRPLNLPLWAIFLTMTDRREFKANVIRHVVLDRWFLRTRQADIQKG